MTGPADELITELSSRKAAIDTEFDWLIEQYVADQWHRPNTTTILALRQHARLCPDRKSPTTRWRS